MYNQFAKHFASTRAATEIWGTVQKFMDMIEPNSKILDAGCGSGKNMGLRTDCQYQGIDNSEALVKICQEQGYFVDIGDITELPYDDNVFDATMCVAVIHHLDTREQRQKAVKELYRVTKPGGLIMIQVWAHSATKIRPHRFVELSGAGDFHVKWKNREDNCEYLRFYHMYVENELNEEIAQAMPGVNMKEDGCARHNYYAILCKDNEINILT